MATNGSQIKNSLTQNNMKWIEFKIQYKVLYKSSIKLFLFAVISRLWCRCIGHKWDKTDKYRQTYRDWETDRKSVV